VGLVLARVVPGKQNEEGLVTMRSILMLLYAVGVVLFAAALALALVRWVIDQAATFSTNSSPR